jgi:hypothetical protein
MKDQWMKRMQRALNLTLVATLLAAAAGSSAAIAQVPGTSPSAAGAPAAPLKLGDLAWVAGCWKGLVNKREFREQWMPPRGELMVGISHTTMAEKTVGYEYLRFEPRADGVWYIITPSDGKEDAFRLVSRTTEKAGDVDYDLFTFERTSNEFPQKIVYRRGTEGWLYAEVSGKVDAAERKVIYPMQRIDCVSGQILEK